MELTTQVYFLYLRRFIWGMDHFQDGNVVWVKWEYIIWILPMELSMVIGVPPIWVGGILKMNTGMI
jgi:hypothetical protein